MKAVYYDLHIHSCLSPCADNDMTPPNIVQMSILKGLDLIALTDHNSCKNCPAVLEAAADSGLSVIPGMELTTAEEVHIICLFSSLEHAMAFDHYLWDRLAPVKNAPRIFGDQLIMDAQENVIGQEDKLLINASMVSISELPALMLQFGGLCYPAHIDRASCSVLSNLGGIPPECEFRAVEVADPDRFFDGGANKTLKSDYQILISSDAHSLSHIAERTVCAQLETPDWNGLAAWIKSGSGSNQS